MIFKNTNWRLALLPVAVCLLLVPATKASAAKESYSWSLVSPNKECQIIVTLSDDGRLSYDALRDGKVVIQKSPLGLQRNDQDFEHALTFTHAGKTFSQKYELFAGVQPRVNHLLNYRALTFVNSNSVPIEIDLAASDEGVAFRYRFPESNDAVHIAESELTGFALPMNARGWLQPYHAAGPYTPVCRHVLDQAGACLLGVVVLSRWTSDDKSVQ